MQSVYHGRLVTLFMILLPILKWLLWRHNILFILFDSFCLYNFIVYSLGRQIYGTYKPYICFNYQVTAARYFTYSTILCNRNLLKHFKLNLMEAVFIHIFVFLREKKKQYEKRKQTKIQISVHLILFLCARLFTNS